MKVGGFLEERQQLKQCKITGVVAWTNSCRQDSGRLRMWPRPMPSKQGENVKRPRLCHRRRCHQGIMHLHRVSRFLLTTLPVIKAAIGRMAGRATLGNQWCARSWSLTVHRRAAMLHTAAGVLVKGGHPRRCEVPGILSHNRQRDLLLTAVGLVNPWAIASPPRSQHLRAAHLEVLPVAGRNLAAGAGPHLRHQAAEVAKIAGNPHRRL